jgi:hypothetical protein
MHSIVLTLLVSACTTPPERAPVPEPDPLRARAALATLRVDNGTAASITVLYRISSHSTHSVTVGRVSAGSVAVLAPVPAREPITLIARTDTGGELVLPARTFEIDAEWTWRIPPDTRFDRPPPLGVPR